MTRETPTALLQYAEPDIAALADESPPRVADTRWRDVSLSIHRDLSSVESEWRALEQRADCTVFQSFGWLSTWQLHIGARRGVRPIIVIGRDERGDILFLLPLAVEPGGLVRRLMWLASDICDYNAPLLAPQFPQRLASRRFLLLWPEILKRIQGAPDLRFDLIHFVRMPALIGTQENPFLHLAVTAHPSGVYLTHLSGDWETFYVAKRSPSTRQRDRTKRNRISEMGEVRLITALGAEEIDGSIDKLISQKTRSFAAMGVGNIFHRPGYPEFFRSLASHPATRDIAHVSRLDVGPVAAAVNFGLTFRGCYYHLLASYDDGEVSRFGAGAAHLHELMRHAIETGCQVFDFTVGDEPYKRDWSDTEASLFDHVAAARWRGAFLALPLLGLVRLKRRIKQTPALWASFCRGRALVGKLLGRARRSPAAVEVS